MTKKEYEVQKALGPADHFLLELVVELPCSRKEVKKAIAKYTYNPILLKWKANGSVLWPGCSYVFDIKCPFEIISKIRTELKECYISAQTTMWSVDQWTTLNYHNL